MASPPTSEVGRQHSLTSDSDSVPASAGKCYFRDLASGKDAPICGCRYFYADDTRGIQTDSALGRPLVASPTWCFCGHHVCFHDQGKRERLVQRTAVSRLLSRLDGRVSPEQSPLAVPRTIRPGGGIERQRTPIGLHHHRTTLHGVPHLQKPFVPASKSGVPALQDQISRDTGFQTRLPYGPHTSYHTTQPAYHYPHSVRRQCHGGTSTSGNILDHRSIPQNDTYRSATTSRLLPLHEDILQSVTELATTPSLPGTPVTRSFQHQNSPALDATIFDPAGQLQPSVTHRQSRATSTSQPTPAREPSLRATLRHVQSFSAPDTRASLAELSSRLDALESASFSHTCVDDLQDRFEAIDGHICELHARYEELERQRVVERSEDASETVRLSGCHVEEKVDFLEQRVQRLEHTSSPSRVEPWELEVIFLPWGRELRNIWVTNNDVDSRVATMPASATAMQDWRQDSTNWLFPRACGPTGRLSGIVYARLQSRGLVQSITVTSNGARALQEQLATAFAGFVPHLKLFHSSSYMVPSKGAGSEGSSYLGLQVQFVPLRKIHKSSRLRFLSTAELATPTLWTCDFLDASVFMKIPSIGLRRLFVTQPSAYLQPSGNASGHHDWSWQRLRELPRVRHSKVDSLPETVDEADAREDCWKWNSRLDPPLSASTSFMSSDAIPDEWRPASSAETLVHKHGFIIDDDIPTGLHDIVTRQVPVTPTSGNSAKHSLSQHMQTDYSRKRRRFSTHNLMTAAPPTPRRSHEPPSPGTIGMFLASRSSQALTSRPGELDGGTSEGGAALAYATPHSNTIKRRAEEPDSGTDQDDWEADVASSAAHVGVKANEEVWEGVDGDELMQDMHTGSNALREHRRGIQDLNRVYDTEQDEEDDDEHDNDEDEDDGDDDEIDSDIDGLVYR